MHSLLKRQLRRQGFDPDQAPDAYAALLRSISEAYDAFDEDRRMVERSLDLSSQELLEANREMRDASELMRATLESTADGILAVDGAGQVLYSNGRLAEIWGIPQALIDRGDDAAILGHVVGQVDDSPERFLTEIQELYQGQSESFGTIGFKDGRVLERYSRPMQRPGNVAGRIWSFRDITDRVRAEGSLRESEQRFRALAQNSSDMILIVGADGKPTYASPSVQRIMGYALDDLWTTNLVALLHPGDLDAGAQSFAAVLQEPGVHPSTEVRLRRADGEHRYIEIVANNLIHDAAVGGVVFNARDVTERVAAEQTLRDSEERLRRMAETTPVGIYQMNAQREVTYVNASACEMFEVRDEAEMNQRRYEDFFPAASMEVMREEHAKRADGVASTYEIEMVGARGTRREVMITGAPVVEEEEPVGVIGTIVDITDRKQQERQMRYAATHDSLTDALNRRRFEEEVSLRIERDAAEGSTSAVLFLDLDDFKAVNDTFGHAVGDRLLTRVTRVLRDELRECDVLARLGGDEFAVLLPDTDSRGARIAARRLLRALAKHPVDIEGRVVDTLASIGIAMIPAHGSTVEELLSRADIAMYEAKDRGRNRVCVYTTRGRRSAAADRLKWKQRIREALDGGGLELFAQPIVDLKTGAVERYELLLRMNGRNGQLLMPGAFLGIAESYGLIAEIDAWVVREAIRLLSAHAAAGKRTRFAVNLSARALDDERLVRVIRKELALAKVDPASICFEITESAAILDAEKAQRLICGLTDLGCEFALDDFGVGFSSFSRLKDLPIHELKIDGSLIQELRENPVDQHMVRAIVELARGLGMRVVAEYVQDDASVELLRGYGVDYGQGYHLGRPIPVGELSAQDAPVGRAA